jgi:hypothetical protein
MCELRVLDMTSVRNFCVDIREFMTNCHAWLTIGEHKQVVYISISQKV